MFTHLKEDIQTIRHKDPAARSNWEVLTCYPVCMRWRFTVWRSLWINGFVGWRGFIAYIALVDRN